MKKYSLLKAIGIVFLFVIVLTWIIPNGGYSNGAFVIGDTTPVGIFDLSRIPLITIANLLQYGLIFILIGGLYGVLNKTGVYSNLVEKIVSIFKNKEKLFLIIIICLMTVLSSFIGLQYAIFILIPFIVAILMNLGFSKITSFASTIGAILVGNIGATYSTDISYYINYYLSLGVNNEILTKIIFLIIITFLFIMFILKGVNINKNNKKSKKNEVKEDIPLYEINNKKKSIIPLVVIFLVRFILLIINMINWKGLFKVTYFSELYNQLISIKIGNYPIVSNILGTITSFGSWTGYDMCIFLFIMTILIGWLYSIKFEEFMEGFVNGIKEMFVPAFYAVLASIVFATLYRFQNSDNNIYYTITNFLMTTFDSMQIFMGGLSSFIGGLFYNDVSSLTVTLVSPITTIVTDTTLYSLFGMMIQVLHGIVMMIIPTSILLVGGLAYMKISYKEWFKYIWKYLLEVLVIGIIIFIIMAMFI